MYQRFLALLCWASALPLPFCDYGAPPSKTSITAACLSIEQKISKSSNVYMSQTAEYAQDTVYYFSSSAENPVCVVQVGTAQDTSIVMKEIARNRIPFNVKSGGHASNAGFSSTAGILISLTRFRKVLLSHDKSSVTVGLGNRWKHVYKRLDGSGVNVVGGRVEGPGVGGYTLGGGYSWLTSQYGLACDTVLRYTLVLPNGEIRDVDETSKDLFFALKGGLNRFGIVTEMVYRTVPQPDEIYGGYKVFTRGQIPALINATNEFSSENKDPKAQVILIIRKVASTTIGIVLFYYGGPHGPAAFAPFNNVWSVYRNVTSGSFLDFAEIMDSDTSASSRGAYHSVPTTRFTKTYLNAVHNETIFHGDPASPHSGTSIYYSVQPFTENYGLLAADSAFPHNDSPQQLNLYYSWSSAADDAYWQRTMQQSVDHLTAIAKAEGIYSPDFSTYPNYAPSHYTWDQVYGATNAARLRSIRAKVDPDMVMELAGGFRS